MYYDVESNLSSRRSNKTPTKDPYRILCKWTRLYYEYVWLYASITVHNYTMAQWSNIGNWWNKTMELFPVHLINIWSIVYDFWHYIGSAALPTASYGSTQYFVFSPFVNRTIPFAITFNFSTRWRWWKVKWEKDREKKNRNMLCIYFTWMDFPFWWKRKVRCV